MRKSRWAAEDREREAGGGGGGGTAKTKMTTKMETGGDGDSRFSESAKGTCCTDEGPNCSSRTTVLLLNGQCPAGTPQGEGEEGGTFGREAEDGAGRLAQNNPSEKRPFPAQGEFSTSSEKGGTSQDPGTGTQSSSVELNISSSGLGAQQPYSPATSPGASSTQSQRSFHFHLPASVSNLRKSGVNLIRNIPSNIRRSSLAMFQMRAMGTVSRDGGGGADEDFQMGAGHGRQQRASADSSIEAETLSLHGQQKPSALKAGFGTTAAAGTAAKRAMRKRISAAKSALRKISRISSHSTGSATSTMTATLGGSGPMAMCSCTNDFFTPKTTANTPSMASPSSLCMAPCSSSSPPCHHQPLHPLRKCLSHWLLPNNDSATGELPPLAAGGTGKDVALKGQPKKKQSWAATFVRKGKRHKTAEAEQARPNLDETEGAGSNFGRSSAAGRKQPLGPSLSWDPQHQEERCRAFSVTSQLSRSRIHSDGSANAKRLPQHQDWPPFSLRAKSNSQSIGEAAEKAGGRQFEKQTKPSSRAGKRRKKSSSALALCRRNSNDRSQSLSTFEQPELGEEGEKTALETSCLHCALLAEHRTTNLRSEIECAVKRLAARLSHGGTPARTRRTLALGDQQKMQERERKAAAQQQETERQMDTLRRQIGTPDIVVSSCNSDGTPAESADEGFWTNGTPSHGEQQQHQSNGTSAGTSSKPGQNAANDSCQPAACLTPLPSSSSAHSQPNMANGTSPLPASTPQEAFEQFRAQQQHSLPPMDTLKPPCFMFGLPCSSSPSAHSSSLCSASPLGFDLGNIASGGLSSPPRSNSVDLSQLRRDIELWSVSSLSDVDACQPINGTEGRPGTAGISTPGGDSIRTVRSRSYDPSSSPEHMLRRPSRIEHLSEIFRKALAKSPVVKRAAVMQEQEYKRMPKYRTSRYWLDEQLNPVEHIWLPSSSISSSSTATVDTECYLGEKDCERLGDKRRCAACHIVAHTACFPLLAKMNLHCKKTFRDCPTNSTSASRRQHAKEGREDGLSEHHWVHRWRLEGRCHYCAKSFQQKMFREKEVIAITCSWCKRSYHNKRSCFSLARFDDHCDRGILRELILPPGWLLRLGTQRRGHQRQQQRLGSFSFGSKDNNSSRDTLKKSKRKFRPFVVKQLDQPVANPSHQQQPLQLISADLFTINGAAPSACIQPLLVFVNPKSGGNKGAKALNTLCWLLNPRQVFDINAMRGPKYGLEMFRKCSGQMRILVCGGDGTVGWVLSTLDSLNWAAYPPIALLPLGTGNDLSRSMGWGGTFSDEPLAEMLQAIQVETSVTHLDRWRLDVFPLPSNTPTTSGLEPNGQPTTALGNEQSSAQQQQQPQQQLEEQLPPTPTSSSAVEPLQFQNVLPLSVMNNYFSIGADAHVALQFHHSRSANPQMLNSRLKNRLAYGGLGTIDLFKRTWKDLSEYISVECDGVDISHKIREFKFHCLLFHNIAFYAGGTIPWGAGGEGVQESCGEVFSRPSPCDGKIEVLGFTTATLAALQMGGRGERIAQCSKVRIETSKPIPMQVDGEPCLLGPSLILLSFHNKVPMLRREKFARLSGSAPANNIVSMNANNRRKSSNNSSGGGGGAGSGQGGSAAGNGTAGQAVQQQQQGHKCSRASLGPDSSPRPSASSPPNSLFISVPIVVVGRYDYDMYRDAVDRLKDTGFELGTLNLEPELELGQLRHVIQQLLSQHQILPFEPGREWRFLDYMSNAEEGAFCISRHQEQAKTVADVCSLDDGIGILIMDEAFPSMTTRSAQIGHELVFCPAKGLSAAEQNLLMRRRISETLRIVLSNESQETHL